MPKLILCKKYTYVHCDFFQNQHSLSVIYKYVKARKSIHQNFVVVISYWVVECQSFLIDLCILIVI